MSFMASEKKTYFSKVNKIHKDKINKNSQREYNKSMVIPDDGKTSKSEMIHGKLLTMFRIVTSLDYMSCVPNDSAQLFFRLSKSIRKIFASIVKTNSDRDAAGKRPIEFKSVLPPNSEKSCVKIKFKNPNVFKNLFNNSLICLESFEEKSIHEVIVPRTDQNNYKKHLIQPLHLIDHGRIKNVVLHREVQKPVLARVWHIITDKCERNLGEIQDTGDLTSPRNRQEGRNVVNFVDGDAFKESIMNEEQNMKEESQNETWKMSKSYGGDVIWDCCEECGHEWDIGKLEEACAHYKERVLLEEFQMMQSEIIGEDEPLEGLSG